MKKTYLLFIFVVSFLLGGCTIMYSSSTTPPNEETTPDNPPKDNTPDDNPPPIIPPVNPNPDDEEDDPQTPPIEDIIIDSTSNFYPYTLTTLDNKITDYTYIDNNLKNKYKIYSAYYSQLYDTIYIAYDFVNTPTQTLKAKDLYEIEKHAINYFVSDKNRSEDMNYLKAVRIYPDRLASSCRRGLNDYNANLINGCADYGGLEAIIDLNNITSLEDFYNPKTNNGYYYEPMRDTFAHEYGHVSTFYHMVYKNDENYEDYLKLRLGNYYNIIYPNGLPKNYTSSDTSYTIQPEEILADDFIELFYNTEEKAENDNNDYTLAYDDLRNSLNGYSSIKMLKSNSTRYNTIKNYYLQFLNYDNRTTYSKPIVVSQSTDKIYYYESYSHIENSSKIKLITSLIDVNLIAVGEVIVNDNKYYRVILSNTFNCPSNYCDKKDVGEKFGYVRANLLDKNNYIKIYKIDKNGNEELTKNNIIPIKNNIFVLPFYDFSYVLNTTNNSKYATMYDYLNTSFSSTHSYQVNIYSFGTLIQ